jgi:hypothetical protein
MRYMNQTERFSRTEVLVFNSKFENGRFTRANMQTSMSPFPVSFDYHQRRSGRERSKSVFCALVFQIEPQFRARSCSGTIRGSILLFSNSTTLSIKLLGVSFRDALALFLEKNCS